MGSVGDLVDKLQAGTSSAAILILGDSTSNNSTEWFYRAMQWLGQQFPAYNVTHTAWNDTLQGWDPTNGAGTGGATYAVQTGAAGDAYVTGTWAAGATLTTPDAAGLRITGDLDVRAKVLPNSWVVGANMCVSSKTAGAGNRGWRFELLANGASPCKLFFDASQDGTNLVSFSSTSNVSANGVADGTAAWVRVTFTAATSAVVFYTSPDGVTWTQLGSPGTLAGITSIFASTGSPEIGARSVGSEPFTGKIYFVGWRAGVGAAGLPKLIVEMDSAIGSTAATQGSGGTFTDSLGKVWTRTGSALTFAGAPGLLLFNGSTPGMAISYSNDVVRGPLQRAIFAPDLSLINYSHNEGTLTSYTSPYQTLISSLLTSFPSTGIVPVTQNPEMTPRAADQIAAHLIRNQQIFALAKSAGYDVVDAFFLMSMSSDDVSVLVGSDGVHPTTVGDELWRGVAANLFAMRLEKLAVEVATRTRRAVVEVG